MQGFRIHSIRKY